MRSRGFTLLELMVASAILAIGLTAMMRAFSEGLVVVRQSESDAVAMTLAQQKLAELEAADTLPDGEESGQCAEPWDRFRWQCEIQTLDDYPALKRVRVSILWAEGHRARVQALEALLRTPPEATRGTTGGATGGATAGTMGGMTR
jgi:general secretion pathway protein I